MTAADHPAPHDRLEPRRDDGVLLATAAATAGTRVLVVGDDGVSWLDDGEPLGEAEAAILLGADADGVLHLAVDAARGRNAHVAERVERFRDPRGAVLRAPVPSIVKQGIGLANWHARTRHCPRCGSRLVVEQSGHRLRCPGDGSEHFPRLEPAIIVAVVASGERFDDGEERVLLGRQEGWPEGWLSTLAGFVEVGETVEECCRREVEEESGVRVGRVDYVATDPWPFPASLMVGLRAEALTTEVVLEDEIVEARWFSRAELGGAMERDEVRVPPPMSIAHRLIREWAGFGLLDFGGHRNG